MLDSVSSPTLAELIPIYLAACRAENAPRYWTRQALHAYPVESIPRKHVMGLSCRGSAWSMAAPVPR
jgi:hypothetical protein